MAIRRMLLALSATALVAAAGFAQDKPAETPKPAKEEAKSDAAEAPALKAFAKKHITEDMRTAINKGLKRLAELQDNNGAFSKGMNHNVAVAVTALSGLAMLASGSTPEKGPYQAQIQKAIDYLISCWDKNSGYIAAIDKGDGSRIHGHGYATLFLAQCYGTQPNNAKLREVLNRAIDRIQKGQTADGGWGYIPDDLTWDEGSTTVCCVQALRAASDSGITVQKKYIQKAVKYLYDTAVPTNYRTPDGTEHKGFTFMYSKSSGWSSQSYAITAAAISSMNGLGVYAEGATWKEQDVGKVYKGGLDWLKNRLDDFLERTKAGAHALDTSHFHYAHFYAVQCMWNAPDEHYFDDYFPRLREYLLKEQDTESSGWKHQLYGDAYSTSFALLILQVPLQYLPLFNK